LKRPRDGHADSAPSPTQADLVAPSGRDVLYDPLDFQPLPPPGIPAARNSHPELPVAALLAMHPHALFVTERGVLRYASDAWLDVTGRTAQEVIGEPLSAFLPDVLDGQGVIERTVVRAVTGPRQVRVTWSTRGTAIVGSIEPLAPGAARQFELETTLAATREAVGNLVRTLGRTASTEAKHVERVANYARRVGEAMQLSPTELEALEWGAWLHDVGKTRVKREVLMKAAPLSPDERAHVDLHPQWGVQVLSDLTFLPWSVFEVVIAHHERWNGSGYPYGLEGQAIPLPARIVAVCDVFDALTSERPYRPAYALHDALDLIEQERGRHFAPDVVDVFLRLMRPEG